MDPLLTMIESLGAEIVNTTRVLEKNARKHPVASRLGSISSVGSLTS